MLALHVYVTTDTTPAVYLVECYQTGGKVFPSVEETCKEDQILMHAVFDQLFEIFWYHSKILGRKRNDL